MAPFVSAGRSGSVLLDPPPRTELDAVSFDADTRVANEAVASDRLDRIAALLNGEDDRRIVFQKIDSLTRGEIVRDVVLFLKRLAGARGAIVLPTYPAYRRSFVDGTMIDENGVKRPSLAERFQSAGVRVACIEGRGANAREIAERAEASLASGAEIVLPNTIGSDDVRAVSDAFKARADIVLVGSAGLAEAIAGAGAEPRPLRPSHRAIFVVGTQSSRTRDQLANLQAQFCARRLSIPPRDWSDADAKRSILNILAPDSAKGGVAVFDLAEADEAPPLVRSAAMEMVTALLPSIRENDLVVLSGGDTARAFLEHAGIRQFEVVQQFEPGVAVCRASNGLRFVTKSGGFGDPEIFCRLVLASMSSERTSA